MDIGLGPVVATEGLGLGLGLGPSEPLSSLPGEMEPEPEPELPGGGAVATVAPVPDTPLGRLALSPFSEPVSHKRAVPRRAIIQTAPRACSQTQSPQAKLELERAEQVRPA